MSNAPDRSAKTACAPPEIARAGTLPEIFHARVALTPKLLAYREYDARLNPGPTGHGAPSPPKSPAGAGRSQASGSRRAAESEP
jgi:hypothetical protein